MKATVGQTIFGIVLVVFLSVVGAQLIAKPQQFLAGLGRPATETRKRGNRVVSSSKRLFIATEGSFSYDTSGSSSSALALLARPSAASWHSLFLISSAIDRAARSIVAMPRDIRGSDAARSRRSSHWPTIIPVLLRRSWRRRRCDRRSCSPARVVGALIQLTMTANHLAQ